MSQHDLLRGTSSSDQPYAPLSSQPLDDIAPVIPHLPLYDQHSPHAVSSTSNSQRGHPSRLEPLDVREHAAPSSDKEKEWEEMQKPCKHGYALYNCISCINARRQQQQQQQQPQRDEEQSSPAHPHSTAHTSTAAPAPSTSSTLSAVPASTSSHPTHLSQLIRHTSHFLLSVVEARGTSSTDPCTAAIVVYPSMHISHLIERMQARLAPASLRPSRRHLAIEHELYGLQKAAKLAEWMYDEEREEGNAESKVIQQHQLNAPQPNVSECALAEAAPARRKLRVDARRRGRVVPLLRAMLREGLVLGGSSLQSILSYHDILHRSQSAMTIAEHHVPDGVIRTQTVSAAVASPAVLSRQHAEEEMDLLVEELLFQLRGQSLQRIAAELNKRVAGCTPDAQGYRPGEKVIDRSGKPSQRSYIAPEERHEPQPQPQQPNGNDKKKAVEETELAFSARAWCDGAILRKEDTVADSHITPQSTVYLLFTSRYHAQPRSIAYHHTHRGGKLHDSYAVFVRHQASRSLIRVHVHVSTKVWQVKHVAVRTCYDLTEAEMEALDTDKDRRMGRADEAEEPQTSRRSRPVAEEESKEQPPVTDGATSGRSRQSTVVQRQRDATVVDDAGDADEVEEPQQLASPAERCVLLLHGRVLYDNDAMVFSGVGPGDVLVVLDKHSKSDQLIDSSHYGSMVGQPQLCDSQLVDRSTLFDVQAAVCQVREYVDAVIHHPTHKQRLWTYFKLMDTDHSGEMAPPELSWALHTVLRLVQQRIVNDDTTVTQQWLVDLTNTAGTDPAGTAPVDSTEANYGFDEPSVVPPGSETTFATFLRLLSDSIVELIRAREFDLMFPAQTFGKPDWWHKQHKHGDGAGEAGLTREDRRQQHDNHRLLHTIFSTLPHLHALPSRQSTTSTADTDTPRDLASEVPEHMHTFLSRAGLSPDFAVNHTSTSKPLNREEGEAANIEHAYILTQLLQAEQERQKKEGAHHNIHRGHTFDVRRRHDETLDSILRHLDLTLTEDLELDEADHEPKHLNAYFATGVLAVATFVLQPLVDSYDAARQLWEKSFPAGWWAVEETARLNERVKASKMECRRVREMPARDGRHERLEQVEHEHLRDLEALWRCRWNRWAQVQRYLYGMCVIFLFTAQRAAFFYTPFVSVAIYHLFCDKDSNSHITLLEAWIPFVINCLLMAYSVNDAVTDRLELDANDEERVKAAFRDSQLLCKEMRSNPVMLEFNTPAHEKEEAEKEKEKKEKEKSGGKHKGEVGDKNPSGWNMDRWMDEGKHLIATGVQVSEHMTGVNHSGKAQHRSIQHGGPGSPRRHDPKKKGTVATSLGGHEMTIPQKSKTVVPVHEAVVVAKQVIAAPVTVVDVPASWWQRCLGRKKQTQTVVQQLDGGHSARVAPLLADNTKSVSSNAATIATAKPLLVGPPNKLAEHKTSRLRMSNAVLNFRLGSEASQSNFLWWQKLLFLALTIAHTIVPGAYRQHVEGTSFFGTVWYDEFVAIGNFFCIPAVYIFLTSLGEACMGYHQLTVRLSNLALVASASEAYEAKIPYFLDIRQPNNLEYWLALREKAKHVEARLLAMMAGAVVGDAVLLIVSAVRVVFYKVSVDLLLVVSIADIGIFSLFIIVFLLIVVQANTVLSEEHLQLLQKLKHQLSFEMVNSQAWDTMTMDVNEDDGRNIDTWSDGCVFDAEEFEEEEELREMEGAILDTEGVLTNRPSRRASMTATARRQSTFSRSSSPRYHSSSPHQKRCQHDLPASDCMTCTLTSHSSTLHHKHTMKLHTVHSMLASLNASCQSTHSHSLTSLRYYRFSLQAQLLNSTIEHLQAMDEPVKLLGLLVDQKLLMQALAAIVTAGASSLSSLVSG